MARVYEQSLFKIGVPTITFVGLLFWYLVSQGLITDVSYSQDTTCLGTVEDPCVALINFTAKEDIFVYPQGYDPWGRDNTVQFSPGVKSWVMQRSWGSGWRTYDLSKPCSMQWCGAKTNYDTNTKYSLAWREGKSYQIRIVAYKNDVTDTVKWSAFSGEIDPVWFGVSVQEDCEMVSEKVMKPLNKTVKVVCKDPKNLSCKEGDEIITYYEWVTEQVEVCEEVSVTVKDKIVPYKGEKKGCIRTDETLCCWTNKDGYDENRGERFKNICRSGESCECVDILSGNVTSKTSKVKVHD